MSAKINISGHRFGRLVALEFVGRCKHRIALWKCQCDCGEEVVTRLSSLRAGQTKSCGCYNTEIHKSKMIGNSLARTDGLSKHYLYRTWVTMRARCSNPEATKYEHYGGRGIRVCQTWDNSFSECLMDMGDRPEGCTLNRIDNDGDYSPDNCEWQTHSEQNRNRRKYTRSSEWN